MRQLAEPADPQRVEEYLLQFQQSQVVLAGIQVGAFQALRDGPATAAELAQRTGTRADALERLLLAAAAMGLLVQSGESYALTEGVRAMLPGIAEHADHLSRVMWPLWSHLAAAVREGRATWREAFGQDENPLFRTGSPQALRSFVVGAYPVCYETGQAIARQMDFSAYRHLVDVGGGCGGTAVAIARQQPLLRATVFDIPPVCAVTGPEIIAREGMADRVQAHPGDFFRRETFPDGGDVMVLTRILHCWSDDQCLALLRNCYDALAPGGSIVIGESMLSEASPGPLSVALLSLHMLVSTGQGVERSPAHYERLLRAAGFTDTAVRPLDLPGGRVMPPPSHIVLARR